MTPRELAELQREALWTAANELDGWGEKFHQFASALRAAVRVYDAKLSAPQRHDTES